MRAHGCIHSGTDLGVNDHACWGFDDRREYVDAALEYLTDGLRLGQRIAYVGGETIDEQRELLAPLGDVAAMVDAGTLQLLELRHLYRIGEPVDPAVQVQIYSAATEAALADGFTGLRVAAQVTDLVTEPETWEAHVRWESTADRLFSTKPLSALCGYQRGRVPEQVLGDLAAVHPASNLDADLVPFHLFGEEDGLALSGEVDLFSSAAFDRALGYSNLDEEPVTLDLGALEFIDHHGFEILAAHTKRLDEGSVRNQPPVVERLCELLELKL